ncbi:MAG: TM2 domain-containing protein [Melioribacteraceae bacterium]|nr:TM2 domain-containing protein [Melioribacteraceae bacterium]
MANVLNILPELTYEEQLFIQNIVKDMDDSKALQFATIYRSRRRDPLLILILTVVGFFGIAGLQRFFVDQIGMGILYLLTGGICFIGTIIDLVNYKQLAIEYNQKQAMQIIGFMR